MHKSLIGLATALFVVASPAVPAYANCYSIEGQPLGFDITGAAAAVATGESHWYGYTATKSVMVTLQPLTGDADLHVYHVSGQSSCSPASSTAGSLFLDWVLLDPGEYNIEVRYYASPISLVEYYVRITP
jgi:hypothetical protein